MTRSSAVRASKRPSPALPPPPEIPSRADLEAAVGRPFEAWAHQCHGVSLALVRACLWPGARVARGFCRAVPGQHSWVVLGDPYATGTYVIDPTLWSYDARVTDVWVGLNRKWHVPHGAGSIWSHGRPPNATPGRAHRLDRTGLSSEAQHFLDLVEPLDVFGWGRLVSGLVEGWPAAEIIGAMLRDEKLAVRVPIDVAGMLTDTNPGGLYLPREGGEDT